MTLNENNDKHKRMDKSEKQDHQNILTMLDLTKMTALNARKRCVMSELLEEEVDCWQSVNQELSLHLLCDSLFSEQQKLKPLAQLC